MSRHYTLDGVEYPSVTTIIGWAFNGGKADALVGWAVRETCNYIERELQEFDGTSSQLGDYIAHTVQTARKEATRKKEEAGDFGSLVHRYIENLMLNIMVVADYPNRQEIIALAEDFYEEIPEDGTRKLLISIGENFIEWAKAHAFRPVMAEKTVVHKERGYAGTLDSIGYLRPSAGAENTLFILDVKTSNHIYKIPFGAQLIAYRNAVRKMAEEGTDGFPSWLDPKGIGILHINKETGKVKFINMTNEDLEYEITFSNLLHIYKIWQSKKQRRGKK